MQKLQYRSPHAFPEVARGTYTEGLSTFKSDKVWGTRTCMGNRPCHAKKNEAHLCGLQYQRIMQDKMATEKARIVLAACTKNVCLLSEQQVQNQVI